MELWALSDLVSPNLVERQAEFVRLILKGYAPNDASRAAGYNGNTAGDRLISLPNVATAIHMELSRRLTTEAAPLAYSVGMQLLKDEATGARVRADLLVKFLGMAGHGAKGADSQSEKQLSEMSQDELHAFLKRNQAEIDRLEAELASRAKDVSAPVTTPNHLVIDAKPLTYLD